MSVFATEAAEFDCEIDVRFEWDAARDIYLVYPVGFVQTERDCKAWKRAFDERFAGILQPVDMVVVLEMFAVSPDIATVWQRYRKFTMSYARYCVRVESSSDVLSISPTKAVPARDLTRGAPSIPDAMERILELRRLATLGQA